MTVFKGFPQNGTFTADEVGRALAGLVQRETSGVPRVGVLAVPPAYAAVPAAWKVHVDVFTYVHQVSGAVRFSGLSAAEQVDIASSASIPSGQARIDLIVWDYTTPQLVVITGTPGVSPVVPSAGGLAPLVTVRVNAGDGAVVSSRISSVVVVTNLAGAYRPVTGVVAARAVVASGASSVPVTFPVGAFSSPPRVQATLSPGARDCNVYVESVTKDGCTIVLGSSSVVARTLGAFWSAEAA